MLIWNWRSESTQVATLAVSAAAVTATTSVVTRSPRRALRCDEDLVPVDAALGEPGPDLPLVAVDRRGVEVPVAGQERGGDGPPGVVAGELPGAEAEQRHPAVLEVGEVTGFEHRSGDPLVFSDGRFVSTGLPLMDGGVRLLTASPEVAPTGWLVDTPLR